MKSITVTSLRPAPSCAGAGVLAFGSRAGGFFKNGFGASHTTAYYPMPLAFGQTPTGLFFNFIPGGVSS